MSHATGAIRLNDGRVFHCEYNGTVDVMRSPIYTTYEEMKADWRGNKWITCNIKTHIKHEAEIATSYGQGFYWPGLVCLDCMCIFNGHESDYNKEKKGLPYWYPNREAYI